MHKNRQRALPLPVFKVAALLLPLSAPIQT
jgi:hypothetical protein